MDKHYLGYLWMLLGLSFLCLFMNACKSKRELVENPQVLQDPASYPALLSKVDSLQSPLPMPLLDVSVSILGHTAQVTYDMTFVNPHDQVLEGTFVFPLRDGQRMVGFAQYLEEGWREGVVVDRTQGQRAYEGVVAQGIDPGLLSWLGGNTFQARFFPLVPQDSQRIRVVIEEDIKAEGVGVAYAHRLRFGLPVKTFRYSWEVIRPVGQVSFVDNPWADLDWQQTENRLIARQTYHEVVPRGITRATLKGPMEEPQVLIEQRAGGETWFEVHIRREAFQKSRTLPKTVGIWWDVSHSRRRSDRDRELALLRQMLATAKPSEVVITTFAHQLIHRDTLVWHPTRLQPLLDSLRDLATDGGTRYDALAFDQLEVEEHWVCTDGQQSPPEWQPTFGSAPVYVINATPGADMAMLRRWAFHEQGDVLDLSSLSIEACRMNWQSSPVYLNEVASSGEVAEILPPIGTKVEDVLTIRGKLIDDEARLTIMLGGKNQTGESYVILLDKTELQGFQGRISRAWAHMKMGTLWGDQAKAAMIELGKKHQLATRYTSFLVLDRVEDYVNYKVVPPLPLQAEYEALLAREAAQQEIEWLSHLDKVATDFLKRRVWWETDFEIPNTPFEVDPIKKEAQGEAEGAIEQDGVGMLDDLETLPELGPKAEQNDPNKPRIAITVETWQGNTPFLDSLSDDDRGLAYQQYLHQKKTYGRQPAFYLLSADWFLAKGDTVHGLRILSTIADLSLGNHELLRLLGHRLLQLGEVEWAISVFKQVLELREEEPQSYRDLGLAYAANGQYQDAVDFLWEVIRKPWDERFPQIGALAAHELNALVALSDEPLNVSEVDTRFLANMPTDLRVLLEWDADQVDMDLWVTDPRGEKCYYQHDLTTIGGTISSDFRAGYGPEEFLLKRAMTGTYQVAVNYYGSRQARLAGPVRVFLTFMTDYGQKSQASKTVILELSDESEVIQAGSFDVE